MSGSSPPADGSLPDVNKGPRIIIATTITTVCALVTVLARLYVRIGVIKNIGLDVSLTLLCYACYASFTNYDRTMSCS